MICSELNNSLIKLGFNSFTSQNFYEQLLFLNSFKDRSLMILFSKSEYTSEICELVKLSKKNNIKTQTNSFIQCFNTNRKFNTKL
ncbi:MULTISPECIES: hypothetical protein [unclassified Spiroplasma]|uniref:hypothetical protein n=1 Tax=unclassified Spiroplasma TaxID=2637901 RepID=UPI0030CF9094